jgi:hypothetical protein
MNWAAWFGRDWLTMMMDSGRVFGITEPTRLFYLGLLAIYWVVGPAS